ncbi:MAG TPA: hypothetical protein HPP77_00615 [Candidatus Hydrogenedentes bacterium]|nr:hypothetical protein [Candidatus Hydrogenedentota bacterium]
MHKVHFLAMQNIPDRHFLPRLRRRYPMRYDTVAMLFYLLVVYVWGLRIHPLGRDYAVLAERGSGLPFPARVLFSAEMRFFEANPLGYHLVNLALLYGCMLLLYHIVCRVVAGPKWLGLLAAVLFMANPVHSESMLNLGGIVDLVPCILALAAFLGYVVYAADPSLLKAIAALALFALAALPHPDNLALVAALALYEAVAVKRENRRFVRLAPFLALGVVGSAIHWQTLATQGLSPARKFAPLYFIFYPVGFLPETARRFVEHPSLGWVSAGVIAVLLALVFRKARHPAVPFGFLAMAAVRLSQGTRAVDPVHLVGGGQLLLANAFFCLALCAVFFRMMAHPKWPRIVIGGTTLLGAVLLDLQIRSVCAWRHAGSQVRTFQAEAALAAATESPGETLGLIPNYQYYVGAPMCLSESIAYDTPFGKALPATSLLPLHYDKPGRVEVAIEAWGPRTGRVVVKGKTPLELAPWPYRLSRPHNVHEAAHVRLKVVKADADSYVIEVTAKRDVLPRKLVSAPTPSFASGQ